MKPESQTLSVSCESCGAQILFHAHERTLRCPYCDSPAVVDRPATLNRPDPLFAFRFLVSSERAREQVRVWIKGRKMGPFGWRKKAQEKGKGKGVYLPTYLYSATAYSSFHAEIGEEYTSGKEKQIEYRHLKGEHAAYLGDVLVTASRGIPNREVERIEPFYMDTLLRYSPKIISGWISEEPSMTREECLVLAREESAAKVREMLLEFLPGDRYKNLGFEMDLRDESLDLTLVPIWVFAVHYDETKPSVRVLVNGQTGEVYGKVPLSVGKVLLLILSVFGVAGFFVVLLFMLGVIH